MDQKRSSKKPVLVRTKEDVIVIKDKLVSAYFLTNPKATFEQAVRATDKLMESVDKNSHFRWEQA
jgi:hypothetical protein